jgi:hypothetical protein
MTDRASALSIVGSQVSPTEWSYDLTFDPLDNYSVFQQFTTITLSGLSGVTSALGPTSTDFGISFIDAINLDWTAQVENGGSTVQWTHDGLGTGDFQIDKHIFGFRVFALGAADGLVSLVTDGFSRDLTDAFPDGSFELDIAGLVAGPVATPATPEPSTWAMLLIGFAGLGLAGWRTRSRGRAVRIGRAG